MDAYKSTVVLLMILVAVLSSVCWIINSQKEQGDKENNKLKKELEQLEILVNNMIKMGLKER